MNQPHTLTATKRKSIIKALSGYTNIVTYSTIEQLASRFHATPLKVRDLLVSSGFQCELPPRPKTPPPQLKLVPKVEKPAMPLTLQEVNILRSARLYKMVGDEFVVANYRLFQKEREAINKLLDAFT